MSIHRNIARIKNSSDYAVLITACITPSEFAEVLITDSQLRLQQYCKGIQFWSNMIGVGDRIIVIDNSGFGKQKIWNALSTYKISRPEIIDVYSVNMNEIPEGLSYGYAELAIIDFALKNIPALRESKYFIKATGRLLFPNIQRLLNMLPEKYLFAVDTRDNHLFVEQPQKFVTTQLMLFNTQFYLNNLVDIKREMTPSISLIENLLYNKLMLYKNTPEAVLRWPASVDPEGYGAHWNKDYGSMRRKLINTARSILRTVAPDWWV